MVPLSFDTKTAREIVGDKNARVVEEKARKDADSRTYAPPEMHVCNTYWGQVQQEMVFVVYREQHTKRSQRNQRKANG